MPAALQPGQQVIRLIPSTTGRQIQPNMLGVVGGLDPMAHDNQPDKWVDYGFFPVQWVNGLWSSMAVMDKDYSWDFYPREQENAAKRIAQILSKQNSVYHVAPTWARDSIRKHGIDPSKCEVERSTEGNGFYCFKNLEQARWYAQYMAHYDNKEPFDIWQATTTLKLKPDYDLVQGSSSDEELSAGSWYHSKPIPKVRLVETVS